MRRRILPLILGGALSIAAIAPASASTTTCNVVNRGGAAALVALVQANVGVAAAVCDVDVNILNNSLNNLLQNANIRALNNILNNSPILSNNDIDVTVSNVLNSNNISILGSGVNLTINR
jgi:hypothetical protein